MNTTNQKTAAPFQNDNNDITFIDVRGARQHNLKNIDVQVPHGKLVVVTGPSGSGKSTLAISTVFAEGQRQFIETLSTYARRYVAELPRPEFDSITGLQPTLCIDQHPSTGNPRSTVGTVTEIHDYLRVLMSRASDICCHRCGQPIRQLAVDEIVRWIEDLAEGTKAIILSPIVRGRRGKHVDALEQIRKAGLLRGRIDGQLVEIEEVVELAPRKNHTIEAVTDRIVVRPGNTQRIAESVRLAVKLSGGTCTVHHQVPDSNGDEATWVDIVFSTKYACPECGVSYPELEPKNFSFNNPYGACAACEGLGWIEQFDLEMVIPDRNRGVQNGAITIWKKLSKSSKGKRLQQLQPFFASNRIDATTPVSKFSQPEFDRFINGDQKSWDGLLIILEKELATCTSESRRSFLESFRGPVACPTCDGDRLGPLSRAALLAGKTINDINRAPLGNLLRFFESLQFDADRDDIARPIVTEITKRLSYLCQVGLEYLTLGRSSDSLSGGEYQRVRLGAAIGSGLANVCYILDEPTIGLHPIDNRRLIAAIGKLKEYGNSIIVVEHDREMMENADWIIDMGPDAGAGGGFIVAQGTFQDLKAHPTSVTGQFLCGARAIAERTCNREVRADRQIKLIGASANNLKCIDVVFPLNLLICVTGVSGSGKSTLIDETLAPAVKRKLDLSAHRPGDHDALEISGSLKDVVRIDQRPIGRSPRSNAATYCGAMDEIRKLFASTKLAKSRGFGPSRFSFNSKHGWCPDCQGYGAKRLEMNFLPDLYKTCESCHGRRFNSQTLEVRYRDYSIADLLNLGISDACDLLENIPRIHAPLKALVDVGLGYLPLGQSSTTLSGGEAQRVKLATELSKKQGGDTLYLLDEPTTGLHFGDVQRLLNVLHQLVDNANTVIVIEHHSEFIGNADWIIDLGPGAGDKGGDVVATGPPATVAFSHESSTLWRA